MFVHAYIHVVHARVCGVCIHVCVCVCVYAYVHECVCLCVYAYVHECVHACVCVCVSVQRRELSIPTFPLPNEIWPVM